ncbi:sigma 54-interacting transcriptional regulator [Candidatus Uabimicrobium sp. HlEnr_7]|uniref:sigma-54-dependent Fis family transcriptional regulator n=1 Tax=Candidatus Uabimicrobium helgolandensis TaxID=3095367 RepID=UPI0035584D01
MNIATLHEILEALNKVLRADLSAILKFENDDTLVVLASSGPLNVPKLKNKRVSLHDRISLSEALQLKEPSVLIHKDHEEHDKDTYSDVLDLPIDHSCMVAPLRIDQKLLGALTIDVVTCDAFSEDLIKSISGFAHLAAKVMYEEERANDLSRNLEKFAVENANLRSTLKGVALVGQSTPWLNVVNQVRLVAPTPATVLISGETGTGKEQVAHAIHQWSMRSQKSFIALNCSAIVPELALSELFGHEKGAFTGANRKREGRFELAHGGTLFLDEIADLPAQAQAQLLRVIQEKTFERVGGNTTLKTDVRLVAASHKNLQLEVAAGRFREDLFYRLNTFPICLPSLNERREDIALLAEYFLTRLKSSWSMPNLQLSTAALHVLEKYSWPGNVRELSNVLERAAILARGKRITPQYLPLTNKKDFSKSPRVFKLKGFCMPEDLNRLEKAMAREIMSALVESNEKISGKNGAAELLGVPPTTLHSTIKRLRLKVN